MLPIASKPEERSMCVSLGGGRKLRLGGVEGTIYRIGETRLILYNPSNCVEAVVTD